MKDNDADFIVLPFPHFLRRDDGAKPATARLLHDVAVVDAVHATGQVLS